MRRALLAFPLVLLLACGDGLGPTTDLSGRWVAQWVESSDVLLLAQHGDLLTGSGTYYRFLNPPTGTFAVAGSYARPAVKLTLRYDSGLTTHFMGLVTDPFHLVGVETFPGGATDSLKFERR